MSSVFTLVSTYELLLDAGETVRPFRIEVFQSRDDKGVFHGRVWQQTTYNLYHTFSNISAGEGIQNRLLSCDEINREVTSLVADSVEFITGKKCESQEEFLEHALALLQAYHASCLGNFQSKVSVQPRHL